MQCHVYKRYLYVEGVRDLILGGKAWPSVEDIGGFIPILDKYCFTCTRTVDSQELSVHMANQGGHVSIS